MAERGTLRTVPRMATLESEHAARVPIARPREVHRSDGTSAPGDSSPPSLVRIDPDALSVRTIQTMLAAARACVNMGETEVATRLLDDCERLSRRRAYPSHLPHQLSVLRGDLHHLAAAAQVEHFPLTPAEQRLLPVLATHLTFAEIARELFLSRHTVKTQAISIYRKLSVSSRSQAVARAQELALLHD
jgi:DNA-binding CsgD family transcriptional regulator